MGIIFESNKYIAEKPVILLVTDNSESMLNYKDSNEVKSIVPYIQSKISERFGDRFEYEEILVSKSLKDSFSFNGQESDLSNAISEAYQNGLNKNIGAVIMTTDGQYNSGLSPLYQSEKFSLTPFFTIGVGDTVPKKDQYIKDISVNDYAFLNNDFPINIAIESIDLGSKSAKLIVSKNGKPIIEESIQYQNSKYQFIEKNLLLLAEKIGVQRYTVTLSRIEGEQTVKNNVQDFYVEVLESRKKVLLLASAPHPDLAAISSILSKAQNTEIETVLLKSWDGNLSKTDLVLFHEPGTIAGEKANESIKAVNIPSLYIIESRSNATILNRMGLGIEIQNTNQSDDIEASFNEGFLPFEITDELKTAFANWPPLKSKFGQLRVQSGTETLLSQRIGPITKSEPLLFFNSKGKRPFGILYGTGIWRWKMNDFLKNGNFDVFGELIKKTSQFLAVEKDKSPFNIELPKRINQMEDFEVKATFYNTSMEAITTPTIKFTLTNENGEKKEFEFSKGTDLIS